MSFGGWSKGRSSVRSSFVSQDLNRRGMKNLKSYPSSDMDSVDEIILRKEREDKLQAANDAKYADVVKEACELMKNVNKSTETMGMDAPFRPVDEVSVGICSNILSNHSTCCSLTKFCCRTYVVLCNEQYSCSLQ